jgi:hypothetical protein
MVSKPGKYITKKEKGILFCKAWAHLKLVVIRDTLSALRANGIEQFLPQVFSEENFFHIVTADHEMQAVKWLTTYVGTMPRDAGSRQDPKPVPLGENKRIRISCEVQPLPAA